MASSHAVPKPAPSGVENEGSVHHHRGRSATRAVQRDRLSYIVLWPTAIAVEHVSGGVVRARARAPIASSGTNKNLRWKCVDSFRYLKLSYSSTSSLITPRTDLRK